MSFEFNKKLPITILSIGNFRVKSNTCLQRHNALERIGTIVHKIEARPSQTSLLYKIANKLFRIGLPIPLPDEESINRKILYNIQKLHYNVIWIDKGLTIHASTLKKIKSISANTLLISYSPDNMAMRHNQSQDYLKSLPYYDLIITNKSYIKEDLKRLGAQNVIFVNNTFDDLFHYPRKLSLTEKKEFICDVGFIGAWEKERCESILFLAKNNINVRVYGDKSWEKYINMYPTLDIRIGGLYSDNYVKALQSFKISLCFLRKMNFDQQTTRSVEITACGGFLMAERTNEHLSLFEENKEAVYFSSNKELLEKCKFYLKNDPERKQIIENGHKRCIQSGYSNIDTIYKILKKYVYK